MLQSKTRQLTLSLALLLAAAAPALAETVTGTATSGGKVFSYIANESRPSRGVLMWAKKPADVDIAIFADASPDPIPVALGFGTEERLEVVEHGAIGGALYFVVVSKFSGPNSKFYCNVSTEGFETLSREDDPLADGRLHYVGNLATLAAAEPYFASIQEHLAAARAAKRGPAAE
jgi:hypothetical protein